MMIWRTLLVFVPLIWVKCGATKNSCLSDKNCMKVMEMQGNIKSPSPTATQTQEPSWEFRPDFRNDEYALLLRIKRMNLSYTDTGGENWCSGTLKIQGMTFCVAEPNTCFILPESVDCEVPDLSDTCNETFLSLRNHSRYDLTFKNKTNYHKDYHTFEIEHKFIPCRQLIDNTTARAVSPKSISTGRSLIRISEINLMYIGWWRWCAANVVVAGLKSCDIEVNTCFIFCTSPTICKHNLLRANEECGIIIWVIGRKSAALQLQFEEKPNYLEQSHKICFQNTSFGCKESESVGIEPVSTCFPEAKQEMETSKKSGERNTQQSDAKIGGEGDTLISTLTTDSHIPSTPILTDVFGSNGDGNDRQEYSGSGDNHGRQVFSGNRDDKGRKKGELDVATTAEGEFTKEMGTATTLSSQEPQSATKSKHSVTTSSHKQPTTEGRTEARERNIPPSLQTTFTGKAATDEENTYTSGRPTDTESNTLFSTVTTEPPRATIHVTSESEEDTIKSDPPGDESVTPLSTIMTGSPNSAIPTSNKNEVNTYTSDSTTDRKSNTPFSTLASESPRLTTPGIIASEENTLKSDATAGNESDTLFSTLMTGSPSSDTPVSNESSITTRDTNSYPVKFKSDPTTDGEKSTPFSKTTTQAPPPGNLEINEESTHTSYSTTDRESNTLSTLTSESLRPTAPGISAKSTTARKVHTTVAGKAADDKNKDEERNFGNRPAYGESALFFAIWAIYLAILS